MSGYLASVIVPAKDAAETINACLDSLIYQEGFKI